jgi:hypothetical protein
MSDEETDIDYVDHAIYHLERAEHYAPEYMGDRWFQYHIVAAQVYTELAKLAPKVDAEPQYIILTPDQARDYAAMKRDK